jgi:hypothetical protein
MSKAERELSGFSNGSGNSALVSEPDVVMVLSAGLFLVALLRWRAMA